MAKLKLRHKPDVPDDGRFRVRQSSVKLWRKCPYAYHLRYARKLRKKVKSRSLTFGTIVHDMFDAYAEGDDPFKVLDTVEKSMGKLFKTEREEYGEIIDDARQIMTTYFEYYDESDMKYIRLNGRSAEHKFEIDLMDGVVWTGKVDAYVRTPNKLKWILEHKTFKRRPSDDDLWRNVQSSVYLRATQMLGWVKDIEGMCWDYIHNKSPTKPGLLKKGNVISERNITTLPITVKETLVELGLRPRDHQTYIDRIDERLGDWFFRIHTPVNNEVIDSIFDDFVTTVRQMVDISHKFKAKNIEQHCNWCEFESICRAELEGNDVDYTIQHDFYVHEGDEYENAIPEV